MPIFEYVCGSCQHQFEALQGINAKALVKCPECSQNDLQKLVSAPQFKLKGDGWYVTDFRDNKKKDTAASKEKKPDSKQDTTTKD